MTSIAGRHDTGAFVRRLLATEDHEARRVQITKDDLSADQAREAGQALIDEAERLVGVDFARMERVARDAQMLADRAGDEYLWAMARFKQGDAASSLYRHSEARVYLDEAAAVFTKLGCPVEAARTRIIWIWATSKLGDFQAALTAARAARPVLVAHGQTLRVATLDYNVAISHMEHGRYRTALRRLASALRRYESLGAAGRIIMVYHSRALTLTRLGRYREALRDLEHVRDGHHSLGQTAHEAMAIRTIGETYLALGRYAMALRSFEQARSLFGSLDMHAGAVWLACDIADCYLNLNRPMDALAALADAEGDLAHDDSAKDAYRVAARRTAAHLLVGDQQSAQTALNDVERRLPSTDAHDRSWLATQRAVVLLRDGATEEALALARQARALTRRTGLQRRAADALLIEGAALLDLGRINEAAHAANVACRAARTLDAAPLLHRAHELLGRIAEMRRRQATARRQYAAAIVQLEREQQGVIFEFRDSFAAGRGTAYERLAALQLRAGTAAEALATAERAKSRALADAIAGAVELRPRGSAAARRLMRELSVAREDYAAAFAADMRDGNGGAVPADHERTAASDLAALEGRIQDLVRRLQVAGAGDAVADLYGAAPSPELPHLPPDTVLLEFYVSGDDLLRFQAGRDGVRGELLNASVPEVERLLRAFRVNLDATEGATPERRESLAEQARALLRRLHDRLLDGVDVPDGCRALVVVPHGLLHYLPFHALYDGERYLVERVAVSYAPSAALYSVCRERAVRRRSQRGRALVLAHSAGGRLPYTLAEGATVAAALRVPVHAEAAATRALLESRAGRGAGLIHIAAHGRFRADAPLFAHIELADGPLTTADVFSLDLRAALVTLSACETGRAVLGGGDELVGLTRAFLYAGAAGLLVSQWRVDDASTAALMTRFYQESARGRPDDGYGQALRAAQIAAIHARDIPQMPGEHPFFWAAFQMIGS